MPTPFDNRLLLVHWIAKPLRPTRDIFGHIDPRASELGISARDFCQWARRTFPNLSGISVKTLHGVVWQGSGGSDDPHDVRAITSLDRLQDWLRACNESSLELHTWCVPVGRVNGNSLVKQETALLAQIMNTHVDGVGLKSLSLDVEAGSGFWMGNQGDMSEYWGRLRTGLPDKTHVAVILDYRFRTQGHTAFITGWATQADSLHPMVYPGEFFPSAQDMPIQREMQRAFAELKGFNKPVIPMLQLHDASGPVKRLTRPEEVTSQAEWAFKCGARGVTYFRTGTDHFQSSKWPGLAAVKLPGSVPPIRPAIPPNSVVLWPGDPGYTETLYDNNPPEVPMQTIEDVYGKPAHYKGTVSAQGATVEYRPPLPARGAYRVEVFIPAHLANAQVQYRVMDRPGQPDAEIVTPAIDQGRYSNQWVSLGDYDLDPALPDSGKVSLTDTGPDAPRQTVVFGAVCWSQLPR
jgi:hypothetical protein